MSEANKAVIRRFWDEMLSGHNLNVAEELFTPDFVDHDADDPIEGRVSGVEGAKREVGVFFTAFPDMEVTIDEIIAEGDRVAVRGMLRGTHKGELLGIPPTGKTVNVWAWQTYRLAGGRIAEAWLNVDRLTLLQQLGVIPPPQQSPG